MEKSGNWVLTLFNSEWIPAYAGTTEGSMILILGENGQVGRALAQELGADTLAFDASEINLTQVDFTDKLTAILAQHEVTTLINAAAYTAVDKAQSEEALAMRINGAAVGELANWCKKHDVKLVHYSTDYVFDGAGSAAFAEDAPTNPLGVYGKSKRLGEQLITASGAEHLIFRTSWVYDERGKNFFTTMLRLFAEREEISVVNDQIGAPTYAKHLAQATLKALAGNGIFHVTNSGETSWHGFASAILALTPEAKCKRIIPINSAQYPTPAKRPLNSRLDCTKAKNTFSLILPDWQDALKQCYENFRLRN